MGGGNGRRGDQYRYEHADEDPPRDPQSPLRNPQDERDDRGNEGEVKGTCPARVEQHEGTGSDVDHGGGVGSSLNVTSYT